MLFEAFMVFYLLEILLLISVAVWYYKEPKNIDRTKFPETSKKPLAVELIKMRRFQEHMRRLRGEN